jgi:hypothetical protein
VLQQTPSTQLPLPHSLGPPQLVAFFFVHAPTPDRLHADPAVQVVVAQQTPSTQLPDRHWLLRVPPPFTEQVAPSACFGTHAEDEQK